MSLALRWHDCLPLPSQGQVTNRNDRLSYPS